MKTKFKECAIIDLHLHLDGALSSEVIIKVARKEGFSLPTYDPRELDKYLMVPKDCKSLEEYLTRFDIPNLALQTEYGLKECTLDLLNRLNSQGLKYVEIRMAPQLSTSKGLSQDEVVEILIKTLKEAENIYEIQANLILCMMRHAPKEINEETIRVAKKYLGKGVVLLDIAGAEKMHPNEEFTDLFNLAKSLEVPFTMHSGEDAGAYSVRSALKLGASRIGHGIHAIEDKEVTQELIDRKIPLEICPTSNMDTKSIKKLEDLPVKEFLDLGVKVTINTDDPTVSNTTLMEEYSLLEKLGLTESEVRKIAYNSVDASYMDDELRTKILNYLDNLK